MASTVMVIEVRGRVVSLGSTIDSAFVMRRISHLSAVSTNTRQPECSMGVTRLTGYLKKSSHALYIASLSESSRS